MSRKSNSAKNLSVALIGQGFGLVISFIARIVFIKVLGSEYLGLNGLFSNILSILSLAELGVGEAITFSLYKPLAERDRRKSKMLMDVYKKIYVIIGIAILAIGVSLTPLLPLFIEHTPQISGFNLIYLLFVINTSISYFFSYKRNIIIADQKRYITTLYRYSFYFLLNLAQIFYLLITKDYIGFLILQISFTLIENILISRKADKIYPFLKEKSKVPLDNSTKHELIKNTKAMLMHRIGGTLVSSTDNILMSKFIGLIEVGLYSNYYLITNALYVIFGQFYSSILASVGNLCVGEDNKSQYKVFQRIDFFGFIIHSFSSVLLVNLFNPIISLWIGEAYTFPLSVVLIIVLNFYISGMRRSVITFREASGLFYKDRWKAIIEAFVNLLTSIILIRLFGIIGVFLGTFISSITVCVWVEPYVLYKYAFKRKLREYFKMYFKYTLFSFSIAALSYCATSWIHINSYSTIILRILICAIIFVFGILVFFKHNSNLIYYINLIKNYTQRIKEAKNKKNTT